MARDLVLNAGCGTDADGDVRMDMNPAVGPHVLGIVEHLPFKDGAFAKVLMRNVLEHTPNPGVVLGEARRVLRPAGSVWVQTDNAACLWYHVRLPLRFVEGHAYEGAPGDHHYMLFKGHHLLDLARAAGLEAPEVAYKESSTTRGAARLLRALRPELVAHHVVLTARRPKA